VFAALVLFVSMHPAQWSWPLFVWGLAVGLVGLALVALIGIALRGRAITDDQRLLLRRRLIIYTCCWIAAGLTCGSISAAIDQMWIDIVATVYVALILSAGGVFIARRRNSLK